MHQSPIFARMAALCVLLLTLCTMQRSAIAVQLLAFGDSVDRMMVVELCGAMSVMPGVESVVQEGWGGKSLRYEYSPHGRVASAICTTTHDDMHQVDKVRSDSIAFVQFYGSRPHGPYQVSNKTDPLVDTEPRMQHAYDAYVEQFGHPDILQLHLATWELAQLRRHEANSEVDLPAGTAFHTQAVRSFEHNMRARVAQAQTLAAGSNRTGGTRVSLRTGLWTAQDQHLMPSFNDVLRRLARELSVDLHDMDMDVWSVADWKRSEEPRMFRDPVHPITSYCVHGALKAMRLQYSRYFLAHEHHHQGGGSSRAAHAGQAGQAGHAGHVHATHAIRTHEGGRGGQRQQVWLVAPKGAAINSSHEVADKAFLYNVHTHTRHGGLSAEVLKLLRLGVGDVMEVSGTWLAGASLGEEFAAAILKACNVIRTKMHNYTAPPIPLHLAAGPIFANLRGIATQNSVQATQNIYWGRLKSKILVRIPHEDAGNALAKFFHQDQRCLQFPLESAELLPMGAISPSHTFYNAPFLASNTEGMLVQVAGQVNVYLLKNGVRKVVMPDDMAELLAAMPRAQDRVVHQLDSYQGISIFPEADV